jgi:hypothetical protein
MQVRRSVPVLLVQLLLAELFQQLSNAPFGDEGRFLALS